MRRVRTLLLLSFGLLFLPTARATAPTAPYGCFVVSAATATRVPSFYGVPSGVTLQNNDTATLFVGQDSSVTNANYGSQIPAGWSQAFPYSSSTPGVKQLWVYSIAGTSSCGQVERIGETMP